MESRPLELICMVKAHERTIPVKKKDGSMVRMTMAEFASYKAVKKEEKEEDLLPQNRAIHTHHEEQAGAPVASFSVPPQKTKEPIEKKALVILQPVALTKSASTAISTTTPNTEVFEEQAAAKDTHWGEDDHKSLLDDTFHKEVDIEKGKGAVSGRQDQVNKVLKTISISVDKSVVSRLGSLIESRIKEIRSDEQIKEYLTEDITHGGVGLTKEDAVKVISAIHSELQVPEEAFKKKSPKKATPTPKKSTPQVQKLIPNRKDHAFVIPAIDIKPMMHDIRPPKPQPREKASIGPIDELGHITLKDFRRLGTTPQASKKMILSKFDTLKKESFLLLVKGVLAWERSPLYSAYQESISQALHEGITLKEVLNNQEGLSNKEHHVIVDINKSIRL